MASRSALDKSPPTQDGPAAVELLLNDKSVRLKRGDPGGRKLSRKAAQKGNKEKSAGQMSEWMRLSREITSISTLSLSRHFIYFPLSLPFFKKKTLFFFFFFWKAQKSRPLRPTWSSYKSWRRRRVKKRRLVVVVLIPCSLGRSAVGDEKPPLLPPPPPTSLMLLLLDEDLMDTLSDTLGRVVASPAAPPSPTRSDSAPPPPPPPSASFRGTCSTCSDKSKRWWCGIPTSQIKLRGKSNQVTTTWPCWIDPPQLFFSSDISSPR